MEEHPLIKCEPQWSGTDNSDVQFPLNDQIKVKIESEDTVALVKAEEETSEIFTAKHEIQNSHVQFPLTDQVKVKVESEDTVALVKAEEETSDIIIEKHEIQDVKAELDDEDCTASGTSSKGTQLPLLPSSADQDEHLGQVNIREAGIQEASQSSVVVSTPMLLVTWMCYFCGMIFISEELLKDHMALHVESEQPSPQHSEAVGNVVNGTEIKQYSCHKCGKTFSSRGKSKLDNLEKAVIICMKCCKGSTEKRIVIAVKRKPHVCQICCRRFSKWHFLKNHELIHMPYPCSKCTMTFSQQAELQTHEIAKHTRKPMMTCSYCGKNFSMRSKLNRHLMTHTGEKPYSCSICGNKFSQTYGLVNHMKAHFQDKSHVCVTCGKAFVHRSALVKHMVSHSNARPFTCATCDKTFARRATLKQHVKIHLQKIS